MLSSDNWFKRFFEELKRRRVIRVATIYVIAFWPVIQIADILSPALNLPDFTMRYLLIAFMGGFPLALILAWVFDINKSGVVRTGEDSQGRSLIGRGLELAIISMLVVLISVLFYVQYRMDLFGDMTMNEVGNNSSAQVSSIAVLPFAIFSNNSEDGYFADGLTEELLNVFSRIRNLRVAARTSSFAYKGVNKNVMEIGDELNVGHILEGSVRRNDVDDTIRVTAQLIDVSTGTHVWSQTYDRQYRDIFKIQDEISSSVVSELQVTLQVGEQERLKSRQSANTKALVAYSMGQTELSKRTRAGLKDAIRFFNQALVEDAQYAEVYSGMADAYSLLSTYSHEPGEAHLKEAQKAVDQALALDQELGSAWASQGLVYLELDEKEQAREALQKAMDLNPSYAMAYMWFGLLQDKAAERNRYFLKAFELDPKSPVAGFNLAREHLLAGRETEAMEVFSRIVEADPFYPGAYLLIAQVNDFRGRLDEAVKYYKKVYELEASGAVALELAELYVDLGNHEEADEWIRKARLDMTDEMKTGLKWLELGGMVARGKEEEAREMLRATLASDPENLENYFHAIRAAYHLEDYNKVLELYKKIESMALPDKGELLEDLMEVHLSAAWSYQQSGQITASKVLLAQMENQLNGLIDTNRRINPDIWFTMARIKAVKGNQQMALIHLQRAVDEGWRQHWRPYVDPSMVSLLKLDNFKSMMAGLEGKMDLMREQIALEESSAEDWQS